MSSASKFWTVRECATVLGVSPWWLYQNAAPHGVRVPAVRIGSRIIRFSPQAVEAWLAASPVEQTGNGDAPPPRAGKSKAKARAKRAQ